MICPPNAQALYNEAMAAYNQLITGGQPRVIVDQSGQRIEYTASNRAALYTYIQQLAACLPAGAVPCQGNNGPAGFYF